MEHESWTTSAIHDSRISSSISHARTFNAHDIHNVLVISSPAEPLVSGQLPATIPSGMPCGRMHSSFEHINAIKCAIRKHTNKTHTERWKVFMCDLPHNRILLQIAHAHHSEHVVVLMVLSRNFVVYMHKRGAELGDTNETRRKKPLYTKKAPAIAKIGEESTFWYEEICIANCVMRILQG